MFENVSVFHIPAAVFRIIIEFCEMVTFLKVDICSDI